MRAHLLLVDADASWPLDTARDNMIGLEPYAQIAPTGMRHRRAAFVRLHDRAWLAEESDGTVIVTRRGRLLAPRTPLTDGDIIEVDGVRFMLEIEAEDEQREERGPAFLVMPNGFGQQLDEASAIRIGDGPDFDLRLHLGLEGSGCRVAYDGTAWTVAPEGATPIWVVHGAERWPVEGRARLTNGCRIDIDEAAQVEFLDLTARPDVRGVRIGPWPERDDWPDLVPVAAATAAAGELGAHTHDDRARDKRGGKEDAKRDDKDDETDAHSTMDGRVVHTERKITLEPQPHGVFAWSDRGSVGVDVSAHDLCLLFEGGAVARFGATRAGLHAAVGEIFALLRPRPLTEHVNGELRESILLALRRVAGEHAELANQAEVHIADIEATPLALSRGIVSSKFLLEDVTRFLPCAVAFACIENEPVSDAETPERAEVWADRLSRWRELFLAPGSTARSVNKALTDFGDDVHARTLWGLRKVPLAAPVKSLQHMQLLCAIGAHPHTRGSVIDPALHDVVMDAAPAEIGEALVILDEGGLEAIRANVEAPVEVLAGLLLLTPLSVVREVFRRRPRLPDVFAVALQHLNTPLATETMRPPIPLPRVAGVRFIATVGELSDEGRAMSHCAALYGPRAVAGESYLFRYNDDRHSATVEVDSDGVVLQSRGPGNTKNPASREAERVFTRWGRPLRLTCMGALANPIWAPGGPREFEGAPLRTLGDLMNAYRTYVTETDDVFEVIIDWCVAAARDALDGKCWLVKGTRGADDHIRRLDADGRVAGSSEDALTMTIELGETAGARG